LTRYWAGVVRVLAMNVLFVSVDEAIVRSAHPIRRQHGLLNNDSLIVACMKHLGLSFIATNDEGFRAVSGFTVFKPSDL
jgi:predicted nucleic acid-binding protein